MSAPLMHMAPHGLWMLLGTVALVLLALGLLRALFPDFSRHDISTAPGAQPDRQAPSAVESAAGVTAAEPPPGRRG